MSETRNMATLTATTAEKIRVTVSTLIAVRAREQITGRSRRAAATTAGVRLHRGISNMSASPSFAALSSPRQNRPFIPSQALIREDWAILAAQWPQSRGEPNRTATRKVAARFMSAQPAEAECSPRTDSTGLHAKTETLPANSFAAMVCVPDVHLDPMASSAVRVVCTQQAHAFPALKAT